MTPRRPLDTPQKTPRKLTDLTVRSLPFEDRGQRDYHDDVVSGLCVRVGKATKTFRLVVGVGADRQRFTLGRYDPPRFTLAMARERARDILAARRLAPEQPQRTLTYAEAVQLFLAAYQRKESTRHETERLLTKDFAAIAGQPLNKIKAGEVAEIVDALKPSEGKHALTAAKTLFRWCAGREYIDRNPLANLAPIRPAAARDRVLSNDELTAVWAVCSGPRLIDGRFACIVKLCILTGQRIGQFAALRGEMIDREKRTISWPGQLMKGNRTHAIPYADVAASIIETLPETGLLFSSASGRPFNTWANSKEQLDKHCPLPHWTLHDLRRTYSTVMASLDVAPHIIERLLDHRGGTISGVAAVYNRFRYEEACRQAVTSYEAHVAGLVSAAQARTKTSSLLQPPAA